MMKRKCKLFLKELIQKTSIIIKYKAATSYKFGKDIVFLNEKKLNNFVFTE